MRTLNNLLLSVLLLALLACDSIVDDVQDPIDSVDDPELTDASQIDFLTTGVQARFHNVHDNVSVFSSILSDQFIFGGDIGGGATFPTYQQLDVGAPAEDNNSIDGALNHLGQHRYLADNLLERVAEVDELDPENGGFATDADMASREEALFVGNFHGGLARYMWGAYFGRDVQDGGGVISELEEPSDPTRGEFIPSDEMYDLALGKFEEAEQYATDYEIRLMNTIRARIYLIQDDLAAAEDYASDGLEPGDDAFQSQYVDRSGNQQNAWFSDGGPGRTQTVSAPRFFYDYLANDPAEIVRIPVFEAGTENVGSLIAREAGLIPDEEIDEDGNYEVYAQALYMDRDAPLDFATWQENELILAEIEYRDGNEGSALDRVNTVRGSHEDDGVTLDDLDEIDLDTIFVERDKELFTMGIRLIDQRRADEHQLDVDADQHYWHLDPDDTWRFLRITLQETQDNPNL